MTKAKKPTAPPDSPFPSKADELHRRDHWLWLPLKQEWRDVRSKPEEIVRQRFIRTLVGHYGYSLEQMDQERRTKDGSRSARADLVVWQSAEAKASNRDVAFIAEFKSDKIEVQRTDYYQGESYARATGCEFFVAHNERHTAILRLIPGAPGEFVAINEIPKATDWGDAKRLKEIRESLRAFNRKEFQDLLFSCHSILRDVHKMDPGRAFDTISKILFIKMYVERSGLHGTFTTEYLDRRAASRMSNDPLVHDSLFDLTKDHYKADDLFSHTDRLEISEETFRRIVKLLERFDLSKTGDDIKGLAFERFLGTTFRGELGQFFTPRPVVEFMVDLLDPKEDQLICDPAAGSGGFLIRAFEHVRGQILADIQRQKNESRTAIQTLGLEEDKEDQAIDATFAALNRELQPSDDNNQPVDTRVGRLAWRCIYGTDAEPRAARTAKMNMIMHGDGHGGIHYHDGLLDINGIFNGRFDLVLTNPPFGANVGEDQKVGASDETRVPADQQYIDRCKERYGEPWRASHQRLLNAAIETDRHGKKGLPILDLYEIGKGKKNRPTELIFVERCLNLLKPGGRMGIVLPDGNLNNPSLAWLRRWAEGKAKLLAVVSLPEETFRSSNATVKASLVFLRKFSEDEARTWETVWSDAHAELDAGFKTQRDAAHAQWRPEILSGGSVEAAELLEQLAALGIHRFLPDWQSGEPPAYPRGCRPTLQGKPAWVGEAAKPQKKAAAELKRRAAAALAGVQEICDAQLSLLRARYRVLDEAHTAALWARVRERFDYPVFVAAPKTVGITSTGETGDGVANELPALLKAYHEFEESLEYGAKQGEWSTSCVDGLLLRKWQDLERWYERTAMGKRNSSFPIVPLRELLDERRESVHVDGSLGDWQAITIKFSGVVLPRERAGAFKGAMFAAYPGDLAFSKIDARNGAVGLIPENIPKAVVTSEYPVFIPRADKLRSAYLHHLLRAAHFKAALQRKASGTSGRKRVTPEDFLSLQVPLPTPDEQDALIADFVRAEELEQEAARLRQSAWSAFETALFSPVEAAP